MKQYEKPLLSIEAFTPGNVITLSVVEGDDLENWWDD